MLKAIKFKHLYNTVTPHLVFTMTHLWNFSHYVLLLYWHIINPLSKSHPNKEDLFAQPVTSLCQILDRKPLWAITGWVIWVLWKESVKSQATQWGGLHTQKTQEYKACLHAHVWKGKQSVYIFLFYFFPPLSFQALQPCNPNQIKSQ